MLPKKTSDDLENELAITQNGTDRNQAGAVRTVYANKNVIDNPPPPPRPDVPTKPKPQPPKPSRALKHP